MRVALTLALFPTARLVFCAFISCCSAYAKLGMISSALSSDSDDVTKLLNVSLDLITASNTPNAAGKAAKDGQSGLGGKPSPTLTSKAGTRMDGLKGGAAIADSERAVEVLSFLVSKTKVRHTAQQHLPCWTSLYVQSNLLSSQF